MPGLYEKKTDEELILLVRSGDQDASDCLLSRYKELAAAKANLYFILGGEREDLVQEGMIGLFKAIGSYDPERGAAFRTFAELCINRQMLSAIKRAGQQKNSALNSAWSLESPVGTEEDAPLLGETLKAGPGSDPEATLLLGELMETLRSPENKGFSRLEHQVLELMINGMDYRSIAKRLDKTPKQIDNAMQRIRKKIRAIIEE
jgi:RNA polymerase sporulation-specific sigma factor